jgi:mono/diheme cytochrome c family protein
MNRLLLPLVAVVCLSGCQQKMARQPAYKIFDESDFFADGQSARPLVTGTVARGHLRTDLALFTGQLTAETRDWIEPGAVIGAAAGNPLNAVAIAAAEQPNEVTTFPFPITRDVIRHGRDRYMIYCVVCHDPAGEGKGKIVERGYTRPPSYHIDRLRKVPVGHFFAVMTRGYGSMPSYAVQIPPRDRWAIAAYIRALQLSQHFPEKEMTDEMRAEWKKSGQPPEGGNQR